MSSASYTSCTLVLVYVYVLRHKSVSRVVGHVARLIKPSESVSIYFVVVFLPMPSVSSERRLMGALCATATCSVTVLGDRAR